MRSCIADLRDKEVVNICDGKLFGYVCDVEIDLNSGHLCSIIVPSDGKGLNLLKGGELVIPWDKIEKIGEDIILVNIPDINICCRDKIRQEKKRKSGFFSL